MAKRIHLIAAAAMAITLAACGGGGDDAGTTTTSTGGSTTTTTDTSTTGGTTTGGTTTTTGTTTTGTTTTGTTTTGGSTTGGTTTTPAVAAGAIDKYVGTWQHCVQDGTTWLLDRITVTKTGDNTGTLTYTGTWYAQAGCTGNITDRDGGTGTATIRGQKTVSGITADMVEYQETGVGIFRDLFAIRADGRLYAGVERADSETCRPSATDDCYPTALDVSGFIKQ